MQFCQVRENKGTCLYIVGENEEISIKQVADAIVKAIGFEGDYKVRERRITASRHVP